MNRWQEASLILSITSCAALCAVPAGAGLTRMYPGLERPGDFIAVGHISSTATLQALYGKSGPPCNNVDPYNYWTLIVQDLSSGQILDTWHPECPGGFSVSGVAEGWLADVDGDGRDEVICFVTSSDPRFNGVTVLKFDFATQTLTPGAPPAGSAMAEGFRAVPNPAHRSATISFSVPARETATLEIFDVAGRSVKRVSVHATDPGQQAVLWNGTDESGRQVASGTYFYTVTTSEGQATKKVVLLH